MSELELLQKMAKDIAEIKQNIAELKESNRFPEERISKKIIESVNRSEDDYKKGKYKEAHTKEDVKKFFDNV